MDLVKSAQPVRAWSTNTPVQSLHVSQNQMKLEMNKETAELVHQEPCQMLLKMLVFQDVVEIWFNGQMEVAGSVLSITNSLTGNVWFHPVLKLKESLKMVIASIAHQTEFQTHLSVSDNLPVPVTDRYTTQSTYAKHAQTTQELRTVKQYVVTTCAKEPNLLQLMEPVKIAHLDKSAHLTSWLA